MSRIPFLVSCLALFLAGAALASVFLTSGHDEPGELAAVLPSATTEAEILARLDSLTEENRELRARLMALETRPAPTERVPVTDGFVSREELEAMGEELRLALAARDLTPAESPEFKDQIAGTLAEIRKEEAVEKVRQLQDKRTERLDQDVAKIQQWLELTPAQSSDMRTALLTQYDREAEVRRLWEEGVDEEVLGERKASDRGAFREDLVRFLDAEQLETFWNRARTGGK